MSRSFRESTGLSQRWLAAAVTLLCTIVAAAARLSGLGRIPSLIFDETYYVKDAWSTLTLGYEGTWQPGADIPFALGDTSALDSAGSFVVHPPLGKWLIALGMAGLGQSDPVGWRVAAAVAGTAGVLLVCMLAWTLFQNVWVTLFTGLFLATDGMHLVLSRVGMLDIFLSTFAVGAIWAVARDQRRGGTGAFRPWLLVAGGFLGLACSVKWSGLYLVAALGIFVFLRASFVHYQRANFRWLAKSFTDGLAAFGYLVLVPAVLYLLSWWSWFRHPDAWGAQNGTGFSSWWNYQVHVWNFHLGVTESHPYQAGPLQWLLQLRPTSFWYQRTDEGMQTVLALGNPLLWWVAIASGAALLVAVVLRTRWQYLLIWTGFAGLLFPWFLYPTRTMFAFYSVAFAPLMSLTAAWGICVLGGFGTPARHARAPLPRRVLAASAAAVILVSAFWFWPLWTGEILTPEGFQARMWLRSWV